MGFLAMKILLTGSKGFVGRHLTRQLSCRHEIVEYDLKDGKDIFNRRLLDKNTEGVDIIIHLAAFVSGIESWEKPEEYLTNNIIGTLRVFESAIKNKVRKMILFSSAAVYGQPLTPYGASKIGAEAIAEMFKDKLEVVVIRPFNIYGKWQNSRCAYVIHNFVEGIDKFGKIKIYGSGRQTRDFIFISDVVSVIEYLLETNVPNGPIDLGTGQSVKIVDLARKIGKILDKDYEVIFEKRRREPFESKANTRALRVAGIKVNDFIKIDEGLRKLILNEY